MFYPQCISAENLLFIYHRFVSAWGCFPSMKFQRCKFVKALSGGTLSMAVTQLWPSIWPSQPTPMVQLHSKLPELILLPASVDIWQSAMHLCEPRPRQCIFASCWQCAALLPQALPVWQCMAGALSVLSFAAASILKCCCARGCSNCFRCCCCLLLLFAFLWGQDSL